MISENCCNRVFHPLSKVYDFGNNAVGTLTTRITNVAVKVGSDFSPVAKKVGKFVKNHWKQLIAYILVWSIFITICGWKFGFEATALPITIGLACGLGAGAIAGIIIVRIDPDREKLPVHSLWDGTNHVLKQIKDDGTRNFIWWTAAAAITAFSVFYPYILGALVGLYVGNQIVVKTLQERMLGPDPEHERNELRELKISNTELIEQATENNKRIIELEKRLDSKGK